MRPGDPDPFWAKRLGTRNYIANTFYRICDRTGFKSRSFRTMKEWQGRIVRDGETWEPRQPQDFVRGVYDEQHSPDPRPRATDTFTGPLITKLTAKAANGDSVIIVQYTARMQFGDQLAIMLDNGEMFKTTILGVLDSFMIQTAQRLPFAAAAGNLVTNLTAVNVVTV